MKVIFFGDSITASGDEENGWISLLKSRIEQDVCEAVEFINCGFSGRTSAEGLDRFGEHVLPHLPAIVLIQFGINDAYVHLWQRISRLSISEYIRTLSEIQRIVVASGGTPVVVIPHPLHNKNLHNQGNGLSQAENITPYLAAARRLCLENGISCIDLPELARQQAIASHSITGKDGVHLTPAGHVFICDGIYEKLFQLLAPSPSLSTDH